MTQATPRAVIGWGLVRALGATVALGTLYFIVPLDPFERLPVGVGLTTAMVALMGVTVWQVRAVARAPHPGVRAIEALAVTVPVFILLFAASYYLLAQRDPTSFNTDALTRNDALYFTVTVFATVGFGDLVPMSQMARGLVTVQMVLDLLAIGLGIRVFVAAVQRGRSRAGSDGAPGPGP